MPGAAGAPAPAVLPGYLLQQLIINQSCGSMDNGSMLYGKSLLVYIGHNQLNSYNRLQQFVLVQLLQISIMI
jgi:hypothetical protein